MRARRRSDRKWRPIGICGSDWAAIQKPSSSGSIRGKARRGRDPSLKRGKRVEAEGEKNPHATNILLLLFPSNVPSFPSRRLQGWQPNRWVNFFAAQFNEASLNSLPGAADRSRGTNSGRAAGCGGWKGWERRKGGREEGDFASTTIRKSSLGYAAMRAEGKRERRISLAGAFAPLRLNAPANELLAKTLVEGGRTE